MNEIDTMTIPATTKLNLNWISKKPHAYDLGAGIDYYKLFYRLKQQYSDSYLFESLSLPRHQDRYYTIGFDPVVHFVGNGSTLTIKGRSDVIEMMTGISGRSELIIENINPYDFVKNNVTLNYNSRVHQGGLIGYFCYEAMNYFEPAMHLVESKDYDTFNVGLFLDGVIYDSTTDSMQYYSFYEDRHSSVETAIQDLGDVVLPTKLESVTVLGQNLSREEHGLAIEHMLEGIRAGETFQGEVGMKTRYEIKGDKFVVYDKLRSVNPSPYMFYVAFDDVELFGASPEILVGSTNREVLTTPTAGTVRRGINPKEDMILARKLLNDPKEIAEHNMLVDLHRNDLARVCRVGSVKITDLMYLIKFSHVQHIVSDIVGELAPEYDAYDLLAATMPGGVVTGAPKIETMKIISENEKEPRGPYGGAVGRFSMNGDMVFCLPIRSIFCRGASCYSQASSGVVYDSTVEGEYEEITHKMAAMAHTVRECADDNEVRS